MGLFGKRKSRATRRAEARAIKARAKLEAKLSAKNEARRIKAAQRAESKALKAQLKARRDSDRAAPGQARPAGRADSKRHHRCATRTGRRAVAGVVCAGPIRQRAAQRAQRS